MASMTVKLTWDGDGLGPVWMNPHTLELLFYSAEKTKRRHLKFEVLDHSDLDMRETSNTKEI